MNAQIEALQEEIKQIVNSKSWFIDEKNVSKVKAIEAEISNIRYSQKLAGVNREQQRKRELAKLAYEAEQPETDITTNNCEFHQTKVKKYPKLASIKYLTAKFKDGKYIQLTINGERFYMFTEKHEYNKPTEYFRPETFEEFLKLNSIAPADITIDEFKAMDEKVKEINKEFQEAVKKFDQQKKDLNLYFYSHLGLFKQGNAGHIYEYTPNIY